MLTLNHSHSHQLNDASVRSSVSGISSEALQGSDSLRQPSFRLQNRSSVSQQNSLSTAASGTRQVSRVLVLRGTNVSAVQVAGNGPSNVSGVRQMHSGGSWEFFSNGQFQFTPAGLGVVARTDLFPVVGNYRSTNSGISFSASRSSAVSTGRSAVGISGTISAQNGSIRATVFQRSVFTNAAVVNGTSFGNTTDRTVRVNMNMVRIG